MICCAASIGKSKKKVSMAISVVVSITAALAVLLAITGLLIWRAKKTKARKPGDILSLQTVDIPERDDKTYINVNLLLDVILTLVFS
jgi:hypothetical protein